MTSEAVDRAIEDARETETEIHLKDPNGKASLLYSMRISQFKTYVK